jgi:PAS domain S-box-containing protein
MDKSEALAPVYDLLKLNFIVLLVTIFVVSIVSFSIAKSISGPIAILHRGVEIIGAGNLDYKVGTSSQDEIGRLSRAFDKMTEDLKSTTTSIEKLNQEILERKRIEEQIKRSAQEWQRTFDSMTDAVFILDKDFTILKANKACFNICKTKPEDIIGKKCYEVMHARVNPWPDCPFSKTMADFTPHTVEVSDARIDMPLLVTVSPIFNDKGELIGAVHIAKDITERKQAEQRLQAVATELEKSNQELRQLDQLKTEFVSMVSHELRTPLSITKEGISLILDGVVGETNQKQQKILATAKDNINRLARIIDNLLDISKIESGRMELKRQECNLNELIKKIVSFFEPKAKEKGLKLKSEIPGQTIKVYADSDKIMQLFTNLIDNALKFTEAGYIQISVSDIGNEVLCSVADSGIGIAKENLPKVFGKFQQFGRLPGPGEKGTGLGLSIVKGIIDLHKGKIWVESQEGSGSKFIFTLPKA